MIIVAVKLFSILMDLGKVLLQVGCSDKIIQIYFYDRFTNL